MIQPSHQCTIADHIDTLFYLIQQHQKQQGHSIVRGEDMIRGLIERSARHQQAFDLFWKLVGVNSPKIFFAYFKEEKSLYPDTDTELITHRWSSSEQSLEIPSFVLDAHTILYDRGLKYLDFFTVWYGALRDLSPQFQAYCKQHHIPIKNIISQTDRLSDNTLVLQSGCFAFLNIVNTIMKRLSLSLDDVSTMTITSSQQIDTLIDAFGVQSTQQFVADTDGKLFPHNAYESEVVGSNNSTASTPQQWEKEKSDFRVDRRMMVDQYGLDLTKEARDGRLEPVIGREDAIEQMMFTLLRKNKSNPMLIGEAGVGKTAVVEGLAQKIAEGTVPTKLRNKRIIMIDVTALVAGTRYRGDFEARFRAIMDEAVDPTNNIILFIDEIHTLIGAGGHSGTDDASQLLKPLLARGKIKLIGATTFDEYQQHIEKDAALKRRFQEVYLKEPTLEDTKKILIGLKSRFEDYHNVRITDESIQKAIELADRYIMNKHFPDKAIDIIDEASARASISSNTTPYNHEVQRIQQDILAVQQQIQKAILNQDYYTVASLKQDENNLKNKLHNISDHKSLPLHLRPVVDIQDIGRVLQDKTGVPTSTVTESEIDKLQRLKSQLAHKLIGQDEAVDAVVKTIQRSRLSIINKKKPIASFLFLGPSGVGKTYLAKLIAEEYFGDPNALIRVDMSEFMENYSVSKLIGSAPGYVGYESGGLLTEQVRRKPYSVILLDEIEKANPEVLNILLQILDEGQIKDNKGRVISFKSTIVIMTSNIGADEFAKKKSTIGFSQTQKKNSDELFSETEWKQLSERVTSRLSDFLSPELQNRIDYKIIFKPMTKVLLRHIFMLRLDEFLQQWSDKSGIIVPTYSDEKIDQIIDEIFNPQFGARPVEQYIYNTIEPELIEQVMNTPHIIQSKPSLVEDFLQAEPDTHRANAVPSAQAHHEGLMSPDSALEVSSSDKTVPEQGVETTGVSIDSSHRPVASENQSSQKPQPTSDTTTPDTNPSSSTIQETSSTPDDQIDLG